MRFKPPRNSKRRRILALCAAFVALGLSLDYALYPLGQTSSPKFDHSQNAIWLAFDFAGGKALESPVHLAARLRLQGVRDAYFHVRYIGKSGRLRFDVHASAKRLNAELKSRKRDCGRAHHPAHSS